MGETEQASFDYEICDQDLFSSVAHFVVKVPSFFSDHSPVITWLNVETNIRNKNVAHANDTVKRLPRQFCWENDSTQKFKDALRSSSTQLLIREFLNDEPITNVNTSLEKVEHILIATAKRYYAHPKISSLPVFYVDEKFSYQVIYFNTKSSIFLCQGENLHIKFITLLPVANFFNESTYLLIKFLALISSFLYLYGVQFFPCLHNFDEGIKNICQVLSFINQEGLVMTRLKELGRSGNYVL